MKEIKLHKGTLLAVEVPDVKLVFDTHNGFIVMGVDIRHVEGKKAGLSTGDYRGFRALPSGNWRILGRANELTEEQMKEVVEPAKHSKEECFIDPEDDSYVRSTDCYNRTRWTKTTSTFYKDYTAKQTPRSMTWLGEVDTVQESYTSFLTAHNLTNELLLIKE